LLKDKTKWISRKQSEYRDKSNKIEVIKPIFRNNSTVPYLGKNLKLNVMQSYSVEKDIMKFRNNQLFAFIKTYNRDESMDDGILENRVRLYENWILKAAKNIFKEKVSEYSKIIMANPCEVIDKNLKNRWGSATEKGIINLNVNLIKAPENIIDYIIIHERCHFIIKEHSHRFWSLLKKYVADYKSKIEWLEVNGELLI
jgi:predicted metal-dependent hydrolase